MRNFNAGSNSLRATLAAKVGVSAAEMRAMSFIHAAGEMTPKELSLLLDITTGSMTAMVDRLEAAAMVTRNPHPTDRRSLLLTLTPAGRHATQWAQEVLENAIAEVYAREAGRDAAADAAFLGVVAQALNETARLEEVA
ncbi:MarR family transcriptional regulator [Arthrobacter alpinus]|nr:MarR family transcriptional regulator [Arthrobacter alpinus]